MSTPPRTFVRYILAADRLRHVQLLTLVALSIALGVVPIHLLRMFIDRWIPARDEAQLTRMAAVLVLAALARVAVEYRKGLVAEECRQVVIGRLRSELHAHILHLSPGFLARHAVGDLMNRVQNETGRLGMSVSWIFVDPIVEGTTVAIYGAYLASLDWRLLALALALAPATVLLAPIVNRKLGDASRTFSARMGAYGARLQESLASAAEIQNHGTWRLEEARVDHAQARVVDAWMAVMRLNGALGALSDLSRGVGPVLVYGVGGLWAVRAGLPVGRLVAFGGLLGGLYSSIDKLLKYPPQLRVAEDRYRELARLLGLPRAFVDEAGGLGQTPEETSAGSALELRGVTFEHEPGRPTVEDLNLVVERGEHVALVGPSGCGKSTALALMSGRLPPHGGVVSMDGVALASWPLAARISQLGVVGQTPTLFAGTVRDNLLYAMAHGEEGDPASIASWIPADARVDDEALLALCDDVGLADDLVDFGLQAEAPIDASTAYAALRSELGSAAKPWLDGHALRENLLPRGWDAGDGAADAAALARLREALKRHGLAAGVQRLALDRDVGERGARLSGGQRQKVSLARVLLKRPPVLLLDEVTASLDEASARRVVKRVRDAFAGRTVVAVTHDLDSTTAFDRVVVMERGQVVEQGTRAELLARCGAFHRLVGAADRAVAGDRT